MNIKRVAILGLMVFALLAAPAAAQFILQTETAAGDDGGVDDGPFGDSSCNCYHDWDCPKNNGCDIGTPECLVGTENGKVKDGLCKPWASPPDGEPPADEDSDDEGESEALIGAVNRYFELYTKIIEAEGAGKPAEGLASDFEILEVEEREPLEVKVCSTRPFQLVRRNVLLNLLNNATDRVLGHDFHISLRQEFGTVRHVPDRDAAGELLAAARQAIVRSIRSGSTDNVGAPLKRFWEKHPDYEPLHRGRCYLHGHEAERPPLECQTDGLRRVSEALLSYL